jgi:uncharacterized protein (DUF58 family)
MHLAPRGLALIALVGVLLVAGTWSDARWLVMLGGAVLSIVLLGLAVEAWTRDSRLPLVTASPLRGRLGQRAEFAFVARTRSSAPVEFEYVPGWPEGAHGDRNVRRLRIPAGGEVTDGYSVVADRLGEFAFPPLAARVLGGAELGWWPARLPVGAAMRVAPGYLSADERRRGRGIAGGGERQRRAGAGLELLQLRPYRPNDATRTIDWRASARASELVSRDFALDQHLDIVIALDIGRRSRLTIDGSDRLGHYANACARFAERAVATEDRVGLVLYADQVRVRLPPGRGLAAVRRLRAALEAVTPVNAESDLVSAALAILQTTRVRSLLVLCTDLDDPTGTGQLLEAVSLLARRHQVLVAGLASRELDQLARAPAQTVPAAYLGLAIDAYQDSQRATLSRLRLSGIAALLAQPAQFERALLTSYDALRESRRV